MRRHTDIGMRNAPVAIKSIVPPLDTVASQYYIFNKRRLSVNQAQEQLHIIILNRLIR